MLAQASPPPSSATDPSSEKLDLPETTALDDAAIHNNEFQSTQAFRNAQHARTGRRRLLLLISAASTPQVNQ